MTQFGEEEGVCPWIWIGLAEKAGGLVEEKPWPILISLSQWSFKDISFSFVREKRESERERRDFVLLVCVFAFVTLRWLGKLRLLFNFVI